MMSSDAEDEVILSCAAPATPATPLASATRQAARSREKRSELAKKRKAEDLDIERVDYSRFMRDHHEGRKVFLPLPHSHSLLAE